jgi:hypothetical protein
MNDITKRFFWLSLYAAAMALLEAVVVVYIRHGLLWRAPEQFIRISYISMETWREAATIVMLVAVGWLAGRSQTERWAYGLFAFGLWDIGYYLWLKILIDWPAGLLDWDTLFLIPVVWRGPVLAPVLIALLICLSSMLAVIRTARGEQLDLTFIHVGIILLGGLLALYTFMANALQLLLLGRQTQAELFDWPLFLVAFTLMAVPSLLATWPGLAPLKFLQPAKN